MRRLFLLLAIALFNFGVFGQAVTQGSLFAVNKKGAELGACPLKKYSRSRRYQRVYRSGKRAAGV
jgi:hypothetical protein